MLLSEKYRIVEDTSQITLYEKYQSRVKKDGEYTGETVEKERTLAYYSATPQGRKQAYTRIMNCEISKLEEQTLQAILDTVTRCEEQVKAFWSVNTDV